MIWNVKLDIVAVRVGVGRFPQENTLSLPQSQVSQISASFLPIFIHFHPFHLFSFVFLYCCSFLSILPPFSFSIHSFLENTLSLPQSQVSQIAADFLPHRLKKGQKHEVELKEIISKMGTGFVVVKRNESVIKVWGGRGRRMEETHLSSSFYQFFFKVWWGSGRRMEETHLSSSCSLWSGERTTSFRLHRSSVGDFLTKKL